MIDASVTQRLDELTALEPGWLDGSGARVTAAVVDHAKELLAAVTAPDRHTLGVFPTEEGGVSLEWFDADLQVLTTAEVEPDGTFWVISLPHGSPATVNTQAEDLDEAAALLNGALGA